MLALDKLLIMVSIAIRLEGTVGNMFARAMTTALAGQTSDLGSMLANPNSLVA